MYQIKRFIRWTLNTVLTDILLRGVILFICSGVIASVAMLAGVSDLNRLGTPVLLSLNVLLSQFTLRLLQVKLNTPNTFLGLSINFEGITDFLSGVVIVFLATLATMLLEFLLGWVRFDSFTWSWRSWEETAILVLWFTATMCQNLIAGFWEELVFRGYLIQTPNSKSQFIGSAIISSILFGLLHYFIPPNVPIAVAVLDIILGILFASCYSKRGLFFVIGLHFAWNTIPSSLLGLMSPNISVVRLVNNMPNWVHISGATIDPILLLLLFVLGVSFMKVKGIMVSSRMV